MKMRDFTLHEPQSLSEALKLLRIHSGTVRIMAGGTDLLVDLKQDNIRVAHLVSIKGIEGLSGIEEKDGRVRIGALVTLNGVAGSDLVRSRLPALSEAAASMASNQIRNSGTIGGNIASAVPSADLPPTLIAAGASVVIRGENGERQVLFDRFFLGPRRTVLERTDILTHVIIPRLPVNTGISYKKMKLRGANALAVASVAAGMTMSDGVIEDGCIVLGAVAPTPLTAKEASSMLVGQRPSDELFEAAARKAGEESRPISDIRGSAEYRRELVEILTVRAVKEAYERAKGGI